MFPDGDIHTTDAGKIGFWVIAAVGELPGDTIGGADQTEPIPVKAANFHSIFLHLLQRIIALSWGHDRAVAKGSDPPIAVARDLPVILVYQFLPGSS
jgi:hypothetical protein